MKRLSALSLLLASVLCAQAPRHELALTLGSVRPQERNSATANLDIGSGTALEANYGVRVLGGGSAALYAGAHFLASPQRKISSTQPMATRDIASLYLTPQVTLKIMPGSRLSPWGTFGGGYALYEQSTTRIDGQPNDAPRHIHRGTWMYGGGLDIRIMSVLALRGEVRDFFSGSPAFNVPVSEGQHNVVAGGGFVLRF